MSARVERLFYFLLISASFFVAVNLFQRISFILIPFSIALIFATLLNPAVSGMSKVMPRALAAGICSILLVMVLSLLLLLMIPFLYRETMNVLSSLSDKAVMENIFLKFSEIAKFFDIETSISQKSIVTYLTDDMSIMKTVAANIFQGAENLTALIFLTIISPFMMFMLLKDMPYLSNAIITSLNKKHQEKVSSSLSDLNKLIFGYFGGQFIVSIFLFTFYMVFFSIFDIQNKFYISLIVAISNFFPYIGFYISTVISVFLEIQGVGHIDGYSIGLLLAILGIGQIIEGNLVTPKIVGDRVGLRPIFIILGTMLSIPIFGPIGLVLGTPVTIIISYIFKRFVINSEKEKEGGLKNPIKTIKKKKIKIS